MRREPYRSIVLKTMAALLLCVAAVEAQQANINYVYDELGRLIAVIDQQGDAAVYSYDAVGNLLSIQRVNATDQPGSVAISLVSPNRGKVGTTVVIFGKGFSATPSANAVAFNGTSATVTEAAPNRLVTSVPAGATTGSITLTAPLGNATSPSPFTVVNVTGPLAVTPVVALVLPNRTQQFSATLAGSPTSSVLWTVNGIPGGDTAIGTISTGGLYTAPSTQLVTTVTITAIHIDDVTLTASASATVVAPKPIVTSASIAVTEAATVNKNVATAASLSVSAPAATVSNNLVAAASVQNAPAVTALSPLSAARGTSGLTVTVTGVGFTGATAVAFRIGNAADANITVSNLSVTSDTQLSVTVAVASGAAVGSRVVQVTTPAGASTVLGTGSNLFTVQ